MEDEKCPICDEGQSAHGCENCGRDVCQDCFNFDNDLCQDCDNSMEKDD